MTTVADLVTQVANQFREDAEARIAAAIEYSEAEAKRRMDEFLTQLPNLTPPPVAPPPATADAKNRASRTAVQGGVATILVAGLMALAGALNGNFDFSSSGDWKVVAGTAFGAMIMAGAAFVQRLVNPPKGQ